MITDDRTPQQRGQVPSVGRIVHYTNLGDKDGRYPPEQQAAVITGLNDDGTVALKIFYRTGIFDMCHPSRSPHTTSGGVGVGRSGCPNAAPR